MNRRLQIRRSLLRLARFRELTAIQKLAEDLVAHRDDIAKRELEQDKYAAVLAHYAKAMSPGDRLQLSRYETFEALSRAGEARLERATQRTDESHAAVKEASARLHEANERKDTFEDRLRQLKGHLRTEAASHEQTLLMETWLRTRSTR